MIYIKKVTKTAEADQQDVRAIVKQILAEIAAGRDAVARKFARDLDKWDVDIIVSPDVRRAAASLVPDKLKADIRFAHNNVRRFAEAQRASVTDSEIEIFPGLKGGQKQIPVSAAGCYLPGGRYSHVAHAGGPTIASGSRGPGRLLPDSGMAMPMFAELVVTDCMHEALRPDGGSDLEIIVRDGAIRAGASRKRISQ